MRPLTPLTPPPKHTRIHTDKPAPLSLQARFCASRDLLVVLLPRELLVFDLDLGQPVSANALPPGRPLFGGLLGVFGEGVSQVSMFASGLAWGRAVGEQLW